MCLFIPQGKLSLLGSLFCYFDVRGGWHASLEIFFISNKLLRKLILLPFLHSFSFSMFVTYTVNITVAKLGQIASSIYYKDADTFQSLIQAYLKKIHLKSWWTFNRALLWTAFLINKLLCMFNQLANCLLQTVDTLHHFLPDYLCAATQCNLLYIEVLNSPPIFVKHRCHFKTKW